MEVHTIHDKRRVLTNSNPLCTPKVHFYPPLDLLQEIDKNPALNQVEGDQGVEIVFLKRALRQPDPL